MKRLLLLSALLAGCSSRVGRYDGDPIADPIPPRPPEHMMRRHPDFRFTDYATGKEFVLRFYADQNVRMEIITVREPGKIERPATAPERDFAIRTFEQDWKSKGLEEKLRWHAEVLDNERRMTETLIDLRIQDELAALKTLRERRDDVLFNLRARKDTGVHPKEGDDLATRFKEPSTDFLERELANLEVQIRLGEARLKALEYRRDLRNLTYGRSSAAGFSRESFPVGDLLQRMSANGLISLIERDVEPELWHHPQARLLVENDRLVVFHTEAVATRVRDYLDKLRQKKS